MRLVAIAACVWIEWSGPAAGQSAPSTAGKIAYEYCYGGNDGGPYVACDIVVGTAGEVTTVTSGFGFQPKWSPDGNRILFVSPGDIWLVNIGDQRFIPLTTDSATDSGPAWSPDGSRIAFVSDRTGGPELYSINDDGSDLRRLTNAIGFTGGFAWSPEGGTIAIIRDIDGVRYLYNMKADGSNLVRLTSGEAITGSSAWSPDGTRIAFDCARQVCAVNADGTGQVHLADGHGAVFAPVGNKIAFVTDRSDIAVRGEDGTIIHVAPGIAGDRPVWSPDGASLLFQGLEPLGYEGCCSVACDANTYCLFIYGIYAVNADGTGLQLRATGRNPDWFRPRAGQPSASFTTQCTGSTCVFDATGSSDPDGNIVSYSWHFGDGAGSTGATASHMYAIGGYHWAGLTIVDNDGLTTSVGRTVFTNVAPVASFSSVCSAGTCTFDASQSADPDGSIISYYWTFGDGHGSLGSTATATHSYVSGTFTVTLTVTDSLGLAATAATTLQLVNAPPLASFESLCNLFVCSFDGTASKDDGSIWYSWDFGDGTGGDGAITSHTYSAVGTYAVLLTVIDAAGQQATMTKTVTTVRGEMHIGDLDAYADPMPKGLFAVHVTISVHDKAHRPVANATVSGRWWTDAEASCTTGPAGECAVWAPALVKRGATISFSVQSAVHVMYVYSLSNHDPDGDSDGTRIVLKR